jgi:hypothetical protein
MFWGLGIRSRWRGIGYTTTRHGAPRHPGAAAPTSKLNPKSSPTSMPPAAASNHHRVLYTHYLQSGSANAFGDRGRRHRGEAGGSSDEGRRRRTDLLGGVLRLGLLASVSASVD